jgi:hypothetical protein
MIRILVLLKRKPGLTMEEFITHFETKHVEIGKKIFTGNAVKYSRKYLTPIEDPRGDTPVVPTYDAVMEAWFEDQAHWDAALEIARSPEIVAAAIADSEQFIDRSQRAMYLADLRETDLG